MHRRAGRKIEILKNHQWFSGRTIGLPFVPTVGACTGRVVALASPRATRVPVQLGAGAHARGGSRHHLAADRVQHPPLVHRGPGRRERGLPPAPGVEPDAPGARAQPRKLLNLDTINLGFIRPKEPDDRQMAYCQAQLYARYMLKRFGDDALIKMLMAYRRGLTTDRAIADCFHVEKADFEKGYLAYLDEVIKTIRTRVSEEKPIKFSQLERQAQGEARRSRLERADGLRALRPPRLQGGAAVRRQGTRAQAASSAGQLRQGPAPAVDRRRRTTALAILEPALDPKQPNERVIDLLAELKMKAGQLDEAEKLYELARKDDPFHTKWIAGLARVHLRQKKTAKFLNDLAMIAANDADDIAVRKALAERHLAAGDAAAAEKWANECLYIDVYDPSVHVLLADAQAARQEVRRGDRGIPDRARAQSQEAQRPQGQAGPGPTGRGPARRRQGHARRRPQGRPRASRGQGAARGNRARGRRMSRVERNSFRFLRSVRPRNPIVGGETE